MVASACLSLLILLNIVYWSIYAKLALVVGMTKQISDSNEIDIVQCYIYRLTIRYLYSQSKTWETRVTRLQIVHTV